MVRTVVRRETARRRPLEGRETGAIDIVGGDATWRLLASFKLPWNDNLLGPLVAQALFHGHTVFDDGMALWHRCRPAMLQPRTE